MTLPIEVSLPPVVRPVGGLLAASRPLAELGVDEWWRGVTFTSQACVEPVGRGPCTNEEQEPQPFGGIAVFDPVEVQQIAGCTSLGSASVVSLAERRLEATREWLLSRELFDSTHTDNPSLADASMISGTHSVAEALGCIEQAIADNLHGTGFIHVSPLLATHLSALQVVVEDGLRRVHTRAGNVVVVASGYSGNVIYGTSEVFAGFGQRQTLEDYNREINRHDAWASDIGLAVFDPCFIVGAQTDVDECTMAP